MNDLAICDIISFPYFFSIEYHTNDMHMDWNMQNFPRIKKGIIVGEPHQAVRSFISKDTQSTRSRAIIRIQLHQNEGFLSNHNVKK